MNSSTIVQKFWNYPNVLRDDGMSYGDYAERGKWDRNAIQPETCNRRGATDA